MKIITMASPNYNMSWEPIKAVVLHGTSGSFASALSWLRNPQPDNLDNRVSANYLIDKTGMVVQLVNWQLGQRAWCNGIVENYDKSIKWLVEAVKTRKNPNDLTVSIEHVASKAEMENHTSMTNEQFNSSVELTASILRAIGLSASHETIIGHNQISGTQKYNCPGVIFPPAYTEVLIKRNPDLKP